VSQPTLDLFQTGRRLSGQMIIAGYQPKPAFTHSSSTRR
jgi:hypothetical protein